MRLAAPFRETFCKVLWSTRVLITIVRSLWYEVRITQLRDLRPLRKLRITHSNSWIRVHLIWQIRLRSIWNLFKKFSWLNWARWVVTGHSGSRLVDWHQLISDNQLTSCKSKRIDHCGAEGCGNRWRQDELEITWMRSLCFEGFRKFTFFKRSVCSTESQIQFKIQFEVQLEIVLIFIEGYQFDSIRAFNEAISSSHFTKDSSDTSGCAEWAISNGEVRR